MNEKLIKTAYDMLYLVKCGINQTIPDKTRIESMNLDDVFKVCKFHSLVSLVAITLENYGIELSSEWKQAKEKVARKTILLDMEREQILKYFEENGIWYMSLKGVHLKKLYPKFGMREMSDNDILYDAAYQQQVYDYMIKKGYECENIGKKHHDEYTKPPVYNFELHTSLANKTTPIAFKYYKNIKDKLVPESNKKYEYNFTDEDFYIYITFHEYKHYKVGGTGLRSLVDTYLYLKKSEDKLDWKYIEQECKKLEIYEFENQNRLLSKKIFKDDDLSENERKLLESIFYSGTYGTFENEINNKINSSYNESQVNYKASYIIHRLFPPLSVYRDNYPFCYKTKIFIPVAWLIRLVKVIFKDRDRINSELKILNKNNIEKNQGKTQ